MSDYIERDKLLEQKPFTYVGGYLSSYNSGFLDCAEEARETIKNAPAADVAPVRHCAECIHLMFSDCYGECKRGYLSGIVRPDDYCSRGERKEDNTLNEIIGGAE